LSSSWFLLEWGSLPGRERFDALEVPKNALAKNVRPKLVALVGCVKRHIGKNIILLYQEHSCGNRIEPMPFEKLGADRAAQRYEESCSRSEQDFDAERL
jgi:hypothetical protein